MVAVLEHNHMRDELARKLKENTSNGDQIDTEVYVDSSRLTGTRRIDVAWEFDDKSNLDGIAFVIKSSSEGHKRVDGLRQLYTAAISGYHPVLVTMSDFFHDSSGDQSSFEDLVRTIPVSYVNVNGSQRGDGDPSFELVNDHLPSEIDIPGCL